MTDAKKEKNFFILIHSILLPYLKGGNMRNRKTKRKKNFVCFLFVANFFCYYYATVSSLDLGLDSVMSFIV